MLTAVVFILLYFIYKGIIIPQKREHLIKEKELELKNTQLMALFAELDPDPVLRTNKEGVIIYFNNAANKLGISNLTGANIVLVIPLLKLSLPELIYNNRSVSITFKLNQKYYSVLARGNSFLEIAQFYFTDITSLKKSEYKIKRSNQKLKELSAHLIEKIEEEKQRLARELHDGIGQNLLLLKLKIQNLEERLHFVDFGKNEFRNFHIILESSIQDLKNILYELKPRILEEMGLGPALSLLCSKMMYEGNIKGNINIEGLKEKLESRLELAVYRIIQEALNNIVRHSKADSFNIQLFEDGGKIRLIISDNGVGFDVEKTMYGSIKTNSFGLLNIKERTENYKGHFKIESEISLGTVIVIEFPKAEFAYA